MTDRIIQEATSGRNKYIYILWVTCAQEKLISFLKKYYYTGEKCQCKNGQRNRKENSYIHTHTHKLPVHMQIYSSPLIKTEMKIKIMTPYCQRQKNDNMQHYQE